jgi:fibronectin type 3 domain-containing protein
MLWDPTFTDSAGWYADGGQNGGIVDYIPTMQNWVKAAFPNGDGPQIGCTEYQDWGEDDTTLAGATVHADVLGIFGYYGFDLATTWGLTDTPAKLAFAIYRNYDGKLSTFGDTSVSTTVANPDNLSSFAALRSSDGALTVMVVNKQTGSTPVTIDLANFVPSSAATAYQINSATQTSVASLGSVAVASNAIGATVPAQSVTLFVIPAGTVTTAPPAPTNLVANVGNNTVTLTWVGGGGATKYTIQRGPASTGPFTTVGTVTAPAPESLTDTNVTNGTTYYYQVSGTNSVGAGPYSTPIAAIPLVPPTFTSSATASPNPATQNSSTTITATVKCTANTLTNGTVQIIAIDPTGASALTQTFPAQNFTANQSQTYTASLTPSLTGTYTVQVAVLSATGQLWSANTSAGSITVNSALSFTSTATPNPTSINSSGSSTISFSVTNTGSVALANGIVQLNIYNSSNVSCGYDDITGVNIAAGATQSYTYTWTPSAQSPAVTTSGTYNVDVGVFNSTWATDYYWNTDATITLTGGTSPPAFTSSATPSPASITASGSSTISYSVTDTGGTLSNANVELQVFNSAGTAVGTQVNSGQNFTAGGKLTFSYAWTPASQSPAVTATGPYTVEIGVFNSAWSTDYYWNSNAGTITLTSGTSAPAAPTGLTATAGNASVSLTWTASSGASTYHVYRGTTAGGEATAPVASGITIQSYSDTGLSNGTKYYYKVAAVNAGGTSALSAEASATPEPAVPAAPIGLTATAGNASVALTWTASSGASTYNVYRGTTAGGEATAPVASGITIQSYSDTGLSNGTKYYYKVAAVNAGGTSALSAEASATPEPAVPAAPTGLTATAGNASVSLTWTASGGASTYNVYRGTTAGGEATAPVASGITVQSYSDSGLTNNIKYYYKVAAVNAGGTSALSTEASATPEPAVPAAPTGLTATAGSASVALTWTASSGASTYNVYRGTTAGGEATAPVASGITTQSYSDTGLTTGTKYYYKVAAVNAAGTSARSSEVSATPGGSLPAAPTGLTAITGNASVFLRWIPSKGAESYNVYRGTATGAESATPIATGLKLTDYVNIHLTNGTKYYYKVAAVDAAGTSALSGEATAAPSSRRLVRRPEVSPDDSVLPSGL